MTFAKTCAVLLALSLVAAFAGTQEQTAPVKPEGDWRGRLNAGSAKLDVIFHIVKKKARWPRRLIARIREQPILRFTRSLLAATLYGLK
jgi:hypothetical protein